MIVLSKGYCGDRIAKIRPGTKGASEEVERKLYNNMSKRASEMLKEDIEFMGPVRLRM